MAWFGRGKPQVVTAAEALPGRTEPRRTFVARGVPGSAAEATVPVRSSDRRARPRLLLGRGTPVLAHPGVWSTAGGSTPNPTQDMRQGADLGTQYRSIILYADEGQRITAEASRAVYQQALAEAGQGAITTELASLGEFYYAEDYHQQYLSEAKNPYGYCGLGGTGAHHIIASDCSQWCQNGWTVQVTPIA